MALKALIIMGNHNGHASSIVDLVDELEYQDGDRGSIAVIDASEHYITIEEFKAKLSSYEITPDTRIDIWCHGGRENEREDGSADHVISLLSGVQLTKNVLSIISEAAGDGPIQAHIWSCYAGTAASAVESLPEGSVIMGHGPEFSTVRTGWNVSAIKDSLYETIINGTNEMSKIGQDLVDNLPSYIKQDMSIGIKGMNSEVEIISLEEISYNLSIHESTIGVLREYSGNIIASIESMKKRGVLSEEIKTPIKSTYSDDQILTYEYDRILFDLFERDEGEWLDFSIVLKEGRLISRQEGESLGLSEREVGLLDPKIHKKLLSNKNSENNSYLSTVINDYLFDEYMLDEIGPKIKYLIAVEKMYGNPTLNRALANDSYEEVRSYAKAGVKIGIDKNNINHVLNYCVYIGNNKAVKALLDKGADVNSIDKEGYSALMRAINKKDPEMVSILLDKGADLNIVSKITGLNPLQEAARLDDKTIYNKIKASVPTVVMEPLCPSPEMQVARDMDDRLARGGEDISMGQVETKAYVQPVVMEPLRSSPEMQVASEMQDTLARGVKRVREEVRTGQVEIKASVRRTEKNISGQVRG